MERTTRRRIYRVGPNDDSVLELNGVCGLVEFHNRDTEIGSDEETTVHAYLTTKRRSVSIYKASPSGP